MTELTLITEADFQKEVINASVPVLVDFTATWCGPCKMIDPIVKQLARDWEGKIKVVKMDADQNPDILIQYGVMGIPTLLLFVNGQVMERTSGYQPKDKLAARFNPFIQAS